MTNMRTFILALLLPIVITGCIPGPDCGICGRYATKTLFVNWVLQLNDDSTYIYSYSSCTGSNVSRGTWRVSRDTLKLTSSIIPRILSVEAFPQPGSAYIKVFVLGDNRELFPFVKVYFETPDSTYPMEVQLSSDQIVGTSPETALVCYQIPKLKTIGILGKVRIDVDDFSLIYPRTDTSSNMVQVFLNISRPFAFFDREQYLRERTFLISNDSIAFHHGPTREADWEFCAIKTK